MTHEADALAAVHRAFRSEYGRTVAVVMRTLNDDLDAAEDAVQDAFAAAAETWPHQGVPPNPQAWIVTTARNRAIDRIRRASTAARFAPHLLGESTVEPPPEDDELAMILLCTHPSLSAETQVALTLRFVAGLTAAEIARAFGSTEATVAQRLSRAKRKITDARIGLPEPGRLTERLGVVLPVVYAIYNEGYVTTSGALSRFDLCQEGVRLARLVADRSRGDLEARGLLALLLLLQSRRPARIGPDGGLVALPDQDRTLWSRDLIAEGHALVRTCLDANRPGPYQLQAAIQAVHCDAASDGDTDWAQILALYDLLLPLVPTSEVRLARLVALSRAVGVPEALAQTDPHATDRYELALRGDLLSRTGDRAGAAEHFRRAAELATNEGEREHMRRREHQARTNGTAVP